MIALWIILYIAIACVIGCFLYVQFEGEEYGQTDVTFASIIWPFTIIIIIVYLILKYVCSNLVSFFRYLKTERFHYCKDNIKPCCGQCKHMFYYNNHNELNGCNLNKYHSKFSSEAFPCSDFRKSFLWRFKIRYKWDSKS